MESEMQSLLGSTGRVIEPKMAQEVDQAIDRLEQRVQLWQDVERNNELYKSWQSSMEASYASFGRKDQRTVRTRVRTSRVTAR